MDAFAVVMVLVVIALVALHLRSDRDAPTKDDGPASDPALTTALDEILSPQARLREFH